MGASSAHEVLSQAQSLRQLPARSHAAPLVWPGLRAFADELNLAVFLLNHPENFNKRGIISIPAVSANAVPVIPTLSDLNILLHVLCHTSEFN